MSRSSARRGTGSGTGYDTTRPSVDVPAPQASVSTRCCVALRGISLVLSRRFSSLGMASPLHLTPNLVQRTALDEKGTPVPGRGDRPNAHDMLTGTQEDGTAYFPDEVDHTCHNWTSNTEGSAQVGHHDRHGGGTTSWNAAPATTGCSQDALQSTGGAGRFCCFAAD